MSSDDSPHSRTLCWEPIWSAGHSGVGIEHLILSPGEADSKIVAINDEGVPFRLAYRLHWQDDWRLSSARLDLRIGPQQMSLILRTDGQGHWQDSEGGALTALDGCLDLDIWPTPFTKVFPIRRAPMAVGERREFQVAWIDGLVLSVKARTQAYTRLDETRYRFESLDGEPFQAEFEVDDEGIIVDYPRLFRRIDAES